MNLPESDFVDMFGHPIRPEDFVIYAALWGHSAMLHIGLVTRLCERKTYFDKNWKPTIRVISADQSWVGTGLRQWVLQKKGAEVSLGFLDRMIVVPAEKIPAAARLLLTAALP